MAVKAREAEEHTLIQIPLIEESSTVQDAGLEVVTEPTTQ